MDMDDDDIIEKAFSMDDIDDDLLSDLLSDSISTPELDEIYKIKDEFRFSQSQSSTDGDDDPLLPIDDDFLSIEDLEDLSPGYEKKLLKEMELQERRFQLKLKIEKFVLKMVSDVKKGRPICMSYPKICWEQAEYKDNRLMYSTTNQDKKVKVHMCAARSQRKLLLIIRLLLKVYGFLVKHTTATKRELFYQFLLPHQYILDSAVLNVSNFLEAAPWEFGILSSAKGIVVGELIIDFPESETLDCENGVLIPADIHSAVDLHTAAHFVLIVEKDAIFQKIQDGQELEHMDPFIMITGKGYPDLATRQLLKLIWDKYKIPILILVDADPHGIDIMCTYRFGSMRMCQFSTLLTVPSILWLGVHPSDIDEHSIEKNALLPLSKKDLKLAENLLTRPYILENEVLKQEVEVLLQKKCKAEIEALESLGPNFLTEHYIGTQICKRNYLI